MDDGTSSAPLPESVAARMSPELYAQARAWLLWTDADAIRMLEWSRSIRPPPTPEALASEITWIILCAGRSAQSARTIESKVLAAVLAGTPVVAAFGYRAKAEAIERAWRCRDADFTALNEVLHDPAALIDWCGSIPYVGDDTKFQLAKNCGAQVCKPDIWMSRLAGFPDRPRRPWRERFDRCMELCQTLGRPLGDGIATVDSMLWLACNKGIITVSPDAGPVAFSSKSITSRSIYDAAEAAPSAEAT